MTAVTRDQAEQLGAGGATPWGRLTPLWAACFAPMNPVGAKHYRPDIDALRAVAVLLVIAYHLTLRRWGGGFVGVDVFFVISGYLIGSLILEEMKQGRFSIGAFYARRIRRILPALTVVLIATTVAAYMWLFPTPLSEYGVSLAAASSSLSNFYFWTKTGYLAGIGTSRALLHTWSLAVEEQFYILLPPFLMLIRRFWPTRAIEWVALAALASFVASAIGVYVNANTTFYMAHTRAWELLLGVLVAQGAAPRLPAAWMRAVMALAGFALVFGSALAIPDTSHFPGLAALPPCLGAAMVIAAHMDGSSLVQRALSFRPLVFVGLISYSLYLWHWPIIILGRESLLLARDKFTAVPIAQILALTFVLATLTWLFVERPFRRARAPRWVVFAAAGVSVALLSGVGMFFYLAEGLPGRFPPEVRRVASYLHYSYLPGWRARTCYMEQQGYGRHEEGGFKPSLCLNPSATRPNLLVMGDSFAAHLYHGLKTVLADHEVLQASAAACRPSLGHGIGDRPCLDLWKLVFGDFLPRHRVDLVVIVGHWSDRDFPGLGEVLDWGRAHGVKMMVVGRPPDYDSPVPALLAQAIRTGDPGLVNRHQHRGLADLDRRLEAFVTQRGGRYASAYDAMCPGGVCQHMTASGVPLQFDRDHLTQEGSVVLVDRLAKAGAFR